MRAHPAVIIGVGVFTAVCAAGDFDWFMNNYRARFFVSLFGRTGARVVYGLLGAGFIALGAVLMQQS